MYICRSSNSRKILLINPPMGWGRKSGNSDVWRKSSKIYSTALPLRLNNLINLESLSVSLYFKEKYTLWSLENDVNTARARTWFVSKDNWCIFERKGLEDFSSQVKVFLSYWHHNSKPRTKQIHLGQFHQVQKHEWKGCLDTVSCTENLIKKSILYTMKELYYINLTE